jgi:hypothetical protein
VCDGPADLSALSSLVSGRFTGVGDRRMTGTGRHDSDSNQRKETTPVPHLEMNLAPTAQDMPTWLSR